MTRHNVGHDFAMIMITYLLPPLFMYWYRSFLALSFVQCISYSIAWYLGICVFDSAYKKEGKKWPAFQNLTIWGAFKRYFDGDITTQSKLDDNQQYIFCSFPHGACSANHLLTMTDSCNMLSKVHKGDRRDLCTSILFFIPVLREMLLWLGCVDASSATAHYNLKKDRSILIFIGGQREQLMTTPGEHRIFLSGRKGFIKLALEYGTPLVPMYAFGENECYHISPFLLVFRQWLSQKFQIGIPFVYGRMYTLWPLKVKLHVEVHYYFNICAYT